jgi:Fe-S oxidoreductase
MAGLYGHERPNRARSEGIYQLSWAQHLANPQLAGRVVASGYSCRTQVAIVDGKDLLHPVQMLLARLKGSRQPEVRAPAVTSARREHHEDY